MTKYILELTQEQADIISIATDLYCRIRLGQFNRIIDHTLEEHIDEIGIDDFLQRREEAEKYLLAARTICYPELENTFQHSYGLGHDKKCYVAWNVHQVLRYHAGNDERKPYAIWGELPKINKVEVCEDREE